MIKNSKSINLTSVKEELPMNSKINPVLLAGGSGSRLWPLSRKSYPKQFSNFLGEYSLFQKTALRFKASAKLEFELPMVLTNSDFRFIVVEQLQSIKIDPGSILIEPHMKNTAPAILAASIYAHKKNNDAIMLVAPSDHIIEDVDLLHDAITRGIEVVSQNKMVTFGVKPTIAETGYGYLELAEPSKKEAVDLVRFIEKPTKEKAEQMLQDEKILWNSGLFLFKAKDMIDAFSLFKPKLLKRVKDAINKGKPDLGFFRLDPDTWEKCDAISIDYAVMEKAKNLAAIPLLTSWSDLGGWDAVWKEMEPDSNGVSLTPRAHAIDCSDTLLRSEAPSQEIVGLGLSNIIAVAMPDSVLVADKERAQDVKNIVENLKTKKVSQAEIFPRDYRPWGWFEILVTSDRFQVKRITVNPGASLSLQSHHHRSEHWIVVEGTAKATIGDELKLVSEGESIYIPLGAIHRMENPGKLPMVFIEVQVGSYLKEDDIIRYDDVYSRS